MIIKDLFKKAVSMFTCAVMVSGFLSFVPASADGGYSIPSCVLFAQMKNESIKINAQNIGINGDVVTNGVFTSVGRMNNNINGVVYENQENRMINYHSAIEDMYFDADVEFLTENYVTSMYNTTISTPTFAEGTFNSNGSLFLNNTALMTVEDVIIEGETFNANNSIIYSQLGDVHVDNNNFSMNGLIYAPFGTVYINSSNVSINGLIIAQDIEIIANNSVNINKNENFMRPFESEDYTIPTNIEEDGDILDIGEAYYKEITSLDDIVYAGNGIYCVKNQFLLSADDTVGFSDISALAAQYNATIVGYLQLTNDYQIEFNTDVDIEEIKNIISQIAMDLFVENISLNIVLQETGDFISNDSEWNTEWDEASPGGNNWGIEGLD